jgi:chromosome segregation ATPase
MHLISSFRNWWNSTDPILDQKEREIEFLHGRLKKKREKITQLEQTYRQRRDQFTEELAMCGKENERLQGNIERIRQSCKDKLDAMANALAQNETTDEHIAMAVELDMVKTRAERLNEELIDCRELNEKLIDQGLTAGRELTARENRIATLQKERDTLKALVKLRECEITKILFSLKPDPEVAQISRLQAELEQLKKENSRLRGDFPYGFPPVAVNELKEEIKQLKEKYRDLLQQSPSEICSRTRFQNCSVCNRMDCCDNTSPAKESLANAAQEIKQLKVRLDNCGYYAAQASIESRRSTIGRFLRNIITEAENPLQKRKAA